jgi:ribose transport system permease protein
MLPKGSLRTNLFLALPAIALVAAVVGVMAVRSPDFFAAGNLGNLVNRVLPLALVTLGEATVLIAGRIDLSVGPVVSLASVVLATTSAHLGWLSIPLVLLIGLACGAFNAAGVILLRINPLIMTLATSVIVKGAALVLLPTPGGDVDYGFYSVFYGDDRFFGLPLLVIVVIFAAAYVILGYTRFGRRIHALGSDAHAAYANAVNVPRTEAAAFLVSGLLAGSRSCRVTRSLATT